MGRLCGYTAQHQLSMPSLLLASAGRHNCAFLSTKTGTRLSWLPLLFVGRFVLLFIFHQLLLVAS